MPSDAHYDRVLTTQQLARLRSLVACVRCGQVPQADGWIRHWPGCSVPYNKEGTSPRATSRPRSCESPTFVYKDHVCVMCGGDIPAPAGPKSGNKPNTCSPTCREARRAQCKRQYRERKAAS